MSRFSDIWNITKEISSNFGHHISFTKNNFPKKLTILISTARHKNNSINFKKFQLSVWSGWAKPTRQNLEYSSWRDKTVYLPVKANHKTKLQLNGQDWKRLPIVLFCRRGGARGGGGAARVWNGRFGSWHWVRWNGLQFEKIYRHQVSPPMSCIAGWRCRRRVTDAVDIIKSRWQEKDIADDSKTLAGADLLKKDLKADCWTRTF